MVVEFIDESGMVTSSSGIVSSLCSVVVAPDWSKIIRRRNIDDDDGDCKDSGDGLDTSSGRLLPHDFWQRR
ncbi:unnamed protein product [Microthlaspi erraticum]|uniref:Uncharacterized protein n=1 Tax=Microthlaspi erraticum TaxID=1685480 RepID=A0A6D2IA81_9BRAS|nr:unnamed protein product [Microthlaspi erraticum]